MTSTIAPTPHPCGPVPGCEPVAEPHVPWATAPAVRCTAAGKSFRQASTTSASNREPDAVDDRSAGVGVRRRRIERGRPVIGVDQAGVADDADVVEGRRQADSPGIVLGESEAVGDAYREVGDGTVVIGHRRVIGPQEAVDRIFALLERRAQLGVERGAHGHVMHLEDRGVLVQAGRPVHVPSQSEALHTTASVPRSDMIVCPMSPAYGRVARRGTGQKAHSARGDRSNSDGQPLIQWVVQCVSVCTSVTVAPQHRPLSR